MIQEHFSVKADSVSNMAKMTVLASILAAFANQIIHDALETDDIQCAELQSDG